MFSRQYLLEIGIVVGANGDDLFFTLKKIQQRSFESNRMVELIPFAFLILGAGMAGISMKMMLEHKKRAARFERENFSTRRSKDKHLAAIEKDQAKVKELEEKIAKDQIALAALQLQQREATTHLNELEEKDERLHPSSRRIETDGGEDE